MKKTPAVAGVFIFVPGHNRSGANAVMEFGRLKTFRVVAEMLSFRKAAAELHLTQPAVTAQIKALEDSLGVALFSRVG